MPRRGSKIERWLAENTDAKLTVNSGATFDDADARIMCGDIRHLYECKSTDGDELLIDCNTINKLFAQGLRSNASVAFVGSIKDIRFVIVPTYLAKLIFGKVPEELPHIDRQYHGIKISSKLLVVRDGLFPFIASMYAANKGWLIIFADEWFQRISEKIKEQNNGR